MGWPDLDLTAGIVTVQAKNGFSTKNRKSRQVPIPKILVEALKTYKTMYPERKTIFVNGPERHFPYKLKNVCFKAGFNCGHCVNKKGQSCKDHPVCDEFTVLIRDRSVREIYALKLQ